MSNEEIDLTLTIITRNEEEMIGDCIKSVIASAELAVKKGIIKNYEIIHVDSASTDNTIKIAKKFPIKIVQLAPSWPLSASAGLFIGYKFARGEYFMPVGGDMIMKKNWLSKALPFIMKDDSMGAVSGFEEEYLGEEGYFKDLITESVALTRTPDFIEQAGTAIYRMEVLRKIGGYNPYLKGGEDTDLSFRLLSEGYRIKRLPDTSTVHYWFKKGGKINLIQTLRSTWMWSFGDGQSARYALYNRKYLRKQKNRYFRTRQIWTYLTFMILVAFAGLNLIIFELEFWFLSFVVVFDIICILILINLLRQHNWEKRFIKDNLQNIPYYLVRNVGFIRGYLKKPLPIESYPTDVKIIKTG